MKLRLGLAVAVVAVSAAVPAVAQAATASPNTVAFGNVPLNTTSTVTITFTPDAGYEFGGATGTGLNVPFGVSLNSSCSGPGTCSVIESFTPTSNGAASGTLNLVECPVVGGGICPNTSVPLSGTGVTTPRVSSPSAVDFGAQTTGQPGPVRWLQVQNSGSSPLSFTGGAQITGTNAADFAIPAGDDTCNTQTLAIWQDCWIGVRFTAGAAGPRTATLGFGSNNAGVIAPGTVALLGTGVAPNSGPAGSNGANGTNGQQGPAGKSGVVELVTCRKVTSKVTKKVHGKRKRVTVTKQVCTAKLVSGPVTFKTS